MTSRNGFAAFLLALAFVTELGRIDRDASIRDAGDAVVDAVAARAAGGLISRPSTVLPASSPEMSAAADVGDAEIDEMVAALQGMPAERRPAAADPSADEVNRMKANRIAGRQRQLLSEVPESLRTRGVFLKGTLSANTLASLCEQNEHTFRPTTGPSGKITGYQIVDSSGDLVASGRLKATVFAPQDRYLPQKEVRSLLGQLDDATLQNYIKGISPDTIDAVHESDAEVQEFAEQHSESGDDQERGEHSEGPDQSSTGKP